MVIVKITKLSLIRNDERGEGYEFSARETKDFLFVKRKKGTISGEHYHEGKSKQKDPEILILTMGKLKLYAKDLKTGEELEEIIEAPSKIEIPANVWHEVTALTDIAFIELNSIVEHEKDTIKKKP